MRRFRIADFGLRIWVLTLVFLAGLHLRAADFPPYDGTKERDAFWSFYNHKVLTQLQDDEKRLTGEVAKATDAAARADLETQLKAVREHLKTPEFFTFAKPEDLPKDLKWEDGMGEPEIGDDHAKKGGTMRNYITSFPATIRVLGENGNGSFRGYHYDDVEMGLINLHPDTGKVIPAAAR